MGTCCTSSSDTTTSTRKIFIGDVHGCLDELKLLLEKLNFDDTIDSLYLVGDLVAKGPKSNEVVTFIRSLKNTKCVMGNHDYTLVKCGHYYNKIPDKDFKLYPFNFDPDNPFDGREHKKLAKSFDTQNLLYLAKLPLYLNVKISNKMNVLLVHAGIIPNIKINKQNSNHLLEIRNIKMINNKFEECELKEGKEWSKYYKGPNHIIYGHDAARNLQLNDYSTGIDTGCCYGRYLTGVIINYYSESNDKLNDCIVDIIETKSGIKMKIVKLKAFKTYKRPKSNNGF